MIQKAAGEIHGTRDGSMVKLVVQQMSQTPFPSQMPQGKHFSNTIAFTVFISIGYRFGRAKRNLIVSV